MNRRASGDRSRDFDHVYDTPDKIDDQGIDEGSEEEYEE